MALANAQPKPKLRFYEKRESERERAENWRKLKAAVTRRDGGKACFVCAKPGYDLHHLLMKSLGGRDELMNLKWVCRDDHRAIHGHALKVRWTNEKNRAGSVWFERVER